MPKHVEYMLSFHGQDIGLVYTLPKNVRIAMQCVPGKSILASDDNEARLWYTATRKSYDSAGKYLLPMVMLEEDENVYQYCFFSGNLIEEGVNFIPDLSIADDVGDFKTGMFELPARFNRVFIKDRFSKTENKYYKPGDIAPIHTDKLNRQLKPYTKLYSKLPDEGQSFARFFLYPRACRSVAIGNLDFVVVPQAEYYHSYLELQRKVLRKKKSKSYQFKVSDESKPNTNIPSDKRKVKELAKKSPVLLSDIIRFLVSKNPGKRITLIVSACRSFHPQLPMAVMENQAKTSRISIGEYLNKFAQKDII